MARPSLLILPSTETSHAILAKATGESYDIQRLPPRQLSTINVSDLHIVLPGQTARIFETELPKASRAQHLKMARFAREDDIASPADDLHFALSDEQPPRLAIIDADIMNQLVAQLANLRPKSVYIDYDLLEGDQALFVIDRAVEPGQSALDLDWIESELLKPTDLELVTQFAEGISEDRGINLLQGGFRPRSAIDLPRPALKRFAAMAAIALIGMFFWSNISDRAKLAQAEDLKLKTAEDYRAVTGQNAPSKPGRTAAKAAQSGPKTTHGFLDLSAVLFAGMKELEDIQVDQIRYNANNNTLALRFLYPSFDASARAESAMRQAGGILQTGGVRERDGTFVGEATLSMGSAS